MISRMSPTPVRLAASISSTSTCRPSAMARQGSQTPQGSMVAPARPSGPVQFSPLAMIRAVVVLPTPRTPVSTKACAIRSAAKALRSVRTIASWPIRSAKVGGPVLAGEHAVGAVGGVGQGRPVWMV